MAKKRGDHVTSRDLRGGAASLSLDRRRSARSVHRARRLRVRLLSIQLAAIATRLLRTITVFERKKNRINEYKQFDLRFGATTGVAFQRSFVLERERE